ncbi:MULTISPECIES: diguanylate cyclase domain-containing protein [Thiorhodovibrio]|uniref:diguanylate cyclase domain-containing protein n=1 Tax=Thiorhodovibrio TaxID=61593 RepID=UPI0019132FFE|nr:MULTISPECIES: diguanylate cyclase [Thiorhodovibrio]MBK5968867.1 diguanylate cyclase response regulator [Thiorhodovibrio winogradskyi]WPL12640.1 Bacteriophytochrome cph2 [Thiorhodovibrio litoralis]
MPDKKATVLIVDDQPSNIQLLAALLKADYRILTATRGHKALELAESKQPPDLILLDVIMPDMDGHEVCRRLKDQETTRGIPVIFVTGMNDDKDEEHGLNLGAADYITKPFNPAIVRARVRNQVNLKLRTDMLEQISWEDALTGIPNRRRFDQKLTEECARLTRNDHQSLSLLMLDIDHFKPFNDNYGHGAGDDCLRRVAQALAEVPQRPADLVARYGGEEFAVILPETDAAGAQDIAERLLAAVRALNLEHAYSDVAPHVTLSIGGATHSAAEAKTSPKANTKADAEALKKNADAALYRAKTHGRNQFMSGSSSA